MATDAGRAVRIGCGAGFSGDRIGEAADLVRDGALDFLFFEGLAERTLARSQLERRANPLGGYDEKLERRLRAVLPLARARGTRIITNMGAANPAAAAQMAARTAQDLGCGGLRIAVIEGDELPTSLVADALCMERGEPIARHLDRIVSVNAYIGAEVVADAFGAGAELVIGGRIADPSLVLGPLLHAHGWARDDWPRLGAGTLAGHLLECGFQITGGYFADPGRKEVPDPDRLGFPFADVWPDGRVEIGKLETSGGLISRETVIEQLLYEVHDPAAYLTPDVTADFSSVRIEPAGENRMRLTGASGRARPEDLKVTLGLDGGLLAEAEISYAGPGALGRARLASEIIRKRMARLHPAAPRIRFDLIGYSSLFATAGFGPGPGAGDPLDLRLRVALRTGDPVSAAAVLEEVEALWIAGPAGGAGYRGRISPAIETRSVLVPRRHVETRFRMITA